MNGLAMSRRPQGVKKMYGGDGPPSLASQLPPPTMVDEALSGQTQGPNTSVQFSSRCLLVVQAADLDGTSHCWAGR
jgi:hypothetical protein